MLTITDIAERSDRDRRIALGAILGMGFKPIPVGNAFAVPEEQGEQVIEVLKAYIPQKRRPRKIAS